MKETIEAILKTLAGLGDTVKSYCQDKNIPLKLRWEIFEMCGHLVGVNKVYVEKFKSLPKNFISYDGDYSVSRYETVKLINVINSIELDNGETYPKINIDQLKEEILDKFIWSFTYDW
ncbi:MAG TPA: hypothetical protein PKX31_00285 [Chitinophagaceae bacterium]|nr:hypothetical protein [Chitinophagaceae bacterium]